MVLMRISGTAVTVKPSVLGLLAAIWGVVTWVGFRRHPQRRFSEGLLVGLATFVTLAIVEWGHAFAHIISARVAGAPMDELRITAGMARTLYGNNDVPPDVHRLRALGGPIFNALGFLLSLTIYRLSPRASVARELSGWSAIGHGQLLLMSLAPLPTVDGGTLLKWTLVARGRSEAEADASVERVDRKMGILGVILRTASSLGG
jgi:hypothetical protein